MLRTTVIVMLIAMFLCPGCQTLAYDEEQNIRKYSRIADLNRRMLAEDFEAFMLLDRPSSLTHYQTRPH